MSDDDLVATIAAHQARAERAEAALAELKRSSDQPPGAKARVTELDLLDAQDDHKRRLVELVHGSQTPDTTIREDR